MYEKEKDFELDILSGFDLPPAEIEDLRFITRSGSINWRKVVTADIEKIIKEKHHVSLKENVFNIINYDLDATSSANILDPGFVKLFRLAQLTIEYLLYVQKYLRKLIDRLNEKEILAIQAAENVRKDENELVSDLNELKNTSNKISSLRKGHRVVVFENEVNNIFQCSLCGKVFLDEHYLTAHQQRRHASLQYPATSEISRVKSSVFLNIQENAPGILQKETEKIWKELEVLRERVNECESCNTLKKITAENESKKEETGKKFRRNQDELMEENAVAKKQMEKQCLGEKLLEKSKKENEESKVEYHNESEEPHRMRDDGRLEAQERVWRGRLKALADESTREIESLRRMIASYQEKEHELEEEYKEKIEKLTSQMKEQVTRQVEANVAEEVEPETMPAAFKAEDLQDASSISDSVDTSAPSIQPDDESPIDLNATYTADEKGKTTDSEVDSSDVSNSSIIQRRPENEGSHEELDSRAVTTEIFTQKLKYLGINPKTKRMPEKVFKEKLDIIHKQQKNMAKNIEGYYQLKSNIEEKALAKASQRLQRHDSKDSRLQDEFPSTSVEQTSTTISTTVKRKNIEPFEFSPKNTSATTTSRSLSSSHSHKSRAKPSVIKSVAMVDTSSKSRPWVSVPGPKSNKGMGTNASYVHPKVQEKSVFPGSPASRTIGPKECHGFSSGGGILRGLPSQPSDGEGDKRMSATPSLGNPGNKSVSFLLAHSVVPGKVYKAL